MTRHLLLQLAAVTATTLAFSPMLKAQQTDTEKLATQACASCHGAKGISVSSAFPMLAGQRKEYLERQLKAFRDRTRSDPMAQAYMWGMTAQLDDASIAKLAAYYAAQPAPRGKAGDAKTMATGKLIFEQGVPSAKASACVMCHGKQAEGSPTSPRLAGQHAEYLVKQMALFKSQVRADAAAPAMHAISTGLTFDQMMAVSVYARAQVP